MMFRQWAVKQYNEFVTHPVIYIAAFVSISVGVVFWKQESIVFAVCVWAVLVVALIELRAARNKQSRIVTELENYRIALEQITAELSRYKIATELATTELARSMAKEFVKLALAERDPKLRDMKKKMPPSVGPH